MSCACCNGCAPPRGSNGEQGPQRGPTANKDPKGVQRRTGTRRRRAPRKRGGEPGKGLPHPFPLPRHGRASIKGEGVTSKPYGADGSIADGFGVCQYILTRPSPQRRGERRERREWGNGETARPSTQRATVGRSDCGFRIADFGLKRHALAPPRRVNVGSRLSVNGTKRARPQRGPTWTGTRRAAKCDGGGERDRDQKVAARTA